MELADGAASVLFFLGHKSRVWDAILPNINLTQEVGPSRV